MYYNPELPGNPLFSQSIDSSLLETTDPLPNYNSETPPSSKTDPSSFDNCEEDEYFYHKGYNVFALLVLFVSTLPVLPGFFIKLSGANISNANFFVKMYEVSWFICFLSSLIIYYVVHKIARRWPKLQNFLRPPFKTNSSNEEEQKRIETIEEERKEQIQIFFPKVAMTFEETDREEIDLEKLEKK